MCRSGPAGRRIGPGCERRWPGPRCRRWQRPRRAGATGVGGTSPDLAARRLHGSSSNALTRLAPHGSTGRGWRGLVSSALRGRAQHDRSKVFRPLLRGEPAFLPLVTYGSTTLPGAGHLGSASSCRQVSAPPRRNSGVCSCVPRGTARCLAVLARSWGAEFWPRSIKGWLCACD